MLNPPLKYPFSKITFELTEVCNNNCKHCYIMTDENAACNEESRGLSFEKIKDLLTEARLLGCRSVHFTGGEPLLHKDFPEILSFAAALGLYIEITTNGILVTEEILTILENRKDMVSVRVSLYGLTDETYDLVTETNGQLDDVYSTIGKLYQKEIPYTAELITLPINEKDLEKLDEIKKERPYLKDLNFSLSLFLNKNSSKSKNDSIRKLRFPEERRHELMNTLNRGIKKDIPRLLKIAEKLPKDKIFYCGAGYTNCTVDPRGNVYPCSFLNHPDLILDSKTESLRDCMKKIHTALDNTRSESKAFQNRCGNCFLVTICERCPGTAWVENGKVDTAISYFCKAAHMLARDAGVLKENETAWEVEDWKERCAAL